MDFEQFIKSYKIATEVTGVGFWTPCPHCGFKLIFWDEVGECESCQACSNIDEIAPTAPIKVITC